MVLKQLDRKEEAAECFNAVLAEDPMNAMALHETMNAEDFRLFMREQPEPYLELAILYWHDGFRDTAVELLRDIDSRVAWPTVKMYIA